MSSMWWRLDGKTPVRTSVVDFMESDIDDRYIKQETTKTGVYVSTVFLQLDHNMTGVGDPLLFETMAFYNGVIGGGDDTARYATHEEALVGHEVMMAKHGGRDEPTIITVNEELFDL